MTNPFLSADAAARYAAGRPDVQALALERVRPFLGGTALGVDVACGTGQCSVALTELVSEVRAYDVSAPMLAHARPHPRVTYALSPAEALPLPDECANVMTVFMAFHWFERERFLAEAQRVLRPDGVLALCDSWFAAELRGVPEFTERMHEGYGQRYPPPERDRRPFGEPEARAAGFSFNTQTFTHTVNFDLNQLVTYLLTHSNTIAVTESGQQTPQEVAAWLRQHFAHLLPEGQVGEFVFGGEVRVLSPLA
ncbi:class I SAM-dependent methyltransferase [Deinococcus irradiatisoli]|uniref:class I SAM-dependent methyltransferase n=1 Tax=Deinococcus irradiatisoli TaxID=2202254 RepID=UPI0015E87629|nr:class I SAM-dependent methyltransferase [Deinococcus irradiatisoli]